jgi:hypothetical protein
MPIRDDEEKGVRLSLSEAQQMFCNLPARLQVPSLSPDFTAADSKRSDGFTPVYWAFRRGADVLMKSFLLSTVDIEGQLITDIQSPYGSGGILATCDETSFRSAAVDAFSAWALEAGVVVEFLRLHPLLQGQEAYVQEIWPNRPTVEVVLNQRLIDGYSSRKRSYLRRELDLGPELRELHGIEGLEAFRKLYEENMRVVGASPEYLFPDAYFQLLFESTSARLWGLVYPGPSGLLATAMTLENDSSGIVEYHLGASRRQHGRRAMELLLHQVGQKYADLGFTTYFLGGGRSDSPDDSLLRFKRSFSEKERLYLIGRNVYRPDVYFGLPGAPERKEESKVLFYRD